MRCAQSNHRPVLTRLDRPRRRQVDAVYGITCPAHKVFGLTDAGQTPNTFWWRPMAFDSGRQQGAAYVSDLDVVLIRSRLPSGAFRRPA